MEKGVALIQLLQMLQYNSSTNALNVSVFHNTGSLCPSLASLHLAALSNQPPNSIKAVRAAWSVSVQTGHEGGDLWQCAMLVFDLESSFVVGTTSEYFPSNRRVSFV